MNTKINIWRVTFFESDLTCFKFFSDYNDAFHYAILNNGHIDPMFFNFNTAVRIIKKQSVQPYSYFIKSDFEKFFLTLF